MSALLVNKFFDFVEEEKVCSETFFASTIPGVYIRCLFIECSCVMGVFPVYRVELYSFDTPGLLYSYYLAHDDHVSFYM